MKGRVMSANRLGRWGAKSHEEDVTDAVILGVGCPAVEDDIGGMQSKLTQWFQGNI